MMAENTDNNVPEQTRQSKDYSVYFNAENTSVQRGDSISDDSEVFCTRHECENINEINQKQEKCGGGRDEGTSMFEYSAHHETHHLCKQTISTVNENQRKDRFRVAWDMGTSDMSPGRNNSFSSIRSFDSGYASRKNTVNSIIYMSEDEQTK